jgi:hypothetical protein
MAEGTSSKHISSMLRCLKSPSRRRAARSLRPTIDVYETRLLLSSAASLSHSGPSAALVENSGPKPSAVTYLDAQVLAFAKKNLGKQVGDGQCATLAADAVQAAGGVPFYQLGPTGANANYVWGKLVTTLTTKGGSISSIRAGDIIQFSGVSFTKTIVTTANGGSYTQYSTYSYAHHTAIVSSVSGNTINLLQQNVSAPGESASAELKDQTGTIWGKTYTTTQKEAGGKTVTTTYKFNGGTMWVYRPYK